MTCTITGTAGLPSGAVLPSATFTFTRSPSATLSQGGRVVAPQTVQATSDANGAISVTLLAGNYVAVDSVTSTRFAFVVPEAATANFPDCVAASQIVITPDLVLQAQAARDEAEAFANSFTAFGLTRATRAALVTWAATNTPPVGATAAASGYVYRYIGTGTAISDLPGWVPHDIAWLGHWPATLAGFAEAVAYCANGTLKIGLGTFAYTLTTNQPLAGLSNIVIEGFGQGLSNLTFDSPLTSTQIMTGANVIIRGVSITTTCSVGASITCLFQPTGAGLRFEDSAWTGDINYATGKSANLIKIPTSAVTATVCDDISVIGCKLDNFDSIILKSNTAISTIARIRVQNCRITRPHSESIGINSPAGSITEVIITDNFLDNHQSVVDGQDGHYIAVAGADHVIIAGNTMKGTCREAIHVENAADSVAITGNVMTMDFTGANSPGMITVLPGLSGAGTPPKQVTISDNIMLQTGATRMGFGVRVSDFTSGLQSTSGKSVLIHGNSVRFVDQGYDLVTGGAMGNDCYGNIAVDCNFGFVSRYENAASYHDNTSQDCAYGIGSYGAGRFARHRFVMCTKLVGSLHSPQTTMVTLLGFSVVAADRDFGNGESFTYALADGMDSAARAAGTWHLQMSSVVLTTYLHKDMLGNWDGATLTSTAGIERSANVTATLAVASTILNATVSVTTAQSNCRFSAVFDGTAMLTAVVAS